MTNTRHTYQLHHSNTAELTQKNGLPSGISTEAQLWDQIIKKITYTSPQLLLPLITEIYGRKYSPDCTIVPLSNEYSVERSDTKELSTIQADLTFCVNDTDIYHLECERTYNDQITIRMLEYDFHAALTYRNSRSSSVTPVLEFPKSAVIFLDDIKQIPEFLTCHIKFQDGSTHEYKIPTIAVQSYTLNAIGEKHLSLLIPFLPIRFRNHIPSDREIKSATPDTQQLLQATVEKSKEELTSFFYETILILKQEVADGFLSELERVLILKLLQKSMLRISHSNYKLNQEVHDMTEPLLKLDIDELFDSVHNYEIRLADLNAELVNRNAELANLDAALAERDAELTNLDAALAERDAELTNLDAALAERDAELAKYKQLYGELTTTI